MYAVWGGDPVYPTKNYEQDPDAVADYRNENLHEPTPDIVDKLQDVSLGPVITIFDSSYTMN